MKQLKLIDTGSYKIGLNEVKGLKDTLFEVIKPIQDALKNKIYWNDCLFEESEYKSRDGFIPHSHNHGGVELTVIIPKCEEYEFSFLEFGQCDDTDGDHESECVYENNGDFDAKLRIWFKFEGIDDKGKLNFYIVLSGGNGDAPYFREKYSETIFETEFSASSVDGIKKSASKHITKLLKIIG